MLEAELTTPEEDTRQRRVATDDKSKLWRELMVKESETHMAASVAATIDPPPRKIVMKHDDIIGQVPLEIMNIKLRFANLPPQEIQCIFHNKFKTINLYRLRHMQRIRFDTFQDKERIGIEDGILRLQKTSRIYKNFGKSFHEV